MILAISITFPSVHPPIRAQGQSCYVFLLFLIKQKQMGAQWTMARHYILHKHRDGTQII